MFLFLLELEKRFKWNDMKRIYHTFPEMQEETREKQRQKTPQTCHQPKQMTFT